MAGSLTTTVAALMAAAFACGGREVGSATEASRQAVVMEGVGTAGVGRWW